MDEPKSPPESNEPSEPQSEAERARALILQRRNRFIAAALAGISAASNACSESHGAPPDGAQNTGGAGQVSAAGFSACLSAPGGTGFGGFGGGGPVAGTSGVAGAVVPTVCLSAVDPCFDAEPVPPCVCLEPPFIPDEDAGVDDGSQ